MRKGQDEKERKAVRGVAKRRRRLFIFYMVFFSVIEIEFC